MKPASDWVVTAGGRERRVRVRAVEWGRYRVSIDGEPEIDVEALDPEPGVLSMLVEGRSWEIDHEEVDDGYVIGVLGIPHDVTVADPRRRTARLARASSAAVVRTQMPGRIVRILVTEGAAVAQGDPLVVVEAMKMENELRAPRAGTVKRICVAVGALVEARAALVELA